MLEEENPMAAMSAPKYRLKEVLFSQAELAGQSREFTTQINRTTFHILTNFLRESTLQTKFNRI